MWRNKYGNHRVAFDKEKFDSKKESRRAFELDMLQNAGEIYNLRRQVKFVLIPAQRIGGKVVERECSYIADFVYEKDGQTIVEDVKGYKTPEYVIKRKLMLYMHCIRINEI